ncbi:hypothetical protein [Mesorhizobium sp. B2-4-17]|uniref:hypothetical protein n=1 Tax=Mesorhizobium sp. B2-4-17 TaxID=2589932 RepID=UPI00112BCD45|nr:hypothetical protein [Mesorhizobium sp. B2-4-17]TPK76141.1 hypothetical protein FJ548_26765 [Mesorhizobium sp. B2-4-17]
MRQAVMAVVAMVLLTACSNSDPVQSKSDPNTQPVDQNPKVDKDPTPQTSTGGDQQGTQPAQGTLPAKPASP